LRTSAHWRRGAAPGLVALADKHRIIGDVRGLGVFFALELVTNRATKNRSPLRRELARDERHRGGQSQRGTTDLHQLQPHPRRTAVHDHPAEAGDALARLDAR